MFSKSYLTFVALCILSVSEQAFARHQWLERDDRPVNIGRFAPRRFGQESPAVIAKLSSACAGQICGNLAGGAVTPLLAAQPECSQQDHADKIIDAAQDQDAATKANMIALAIEYRQAEKNTPPDFTTNPPTNRNSVFCQKAPKNPELNGLIQAQDPANGDAFFDPLDKKTIQRGDRPNTAPFGGAAAAPVESDFESIPEVSATATASAEATLITDPAVATSTAEAAPDATGSCVAVVTVTVQPSAAEPTATPCPPDVTVTVTEGEASATQASASSTEAAAAPAVTEAPAAANGDEFGSCTVPQIEFATGFDNRKETSFRAVDLKSFSHGSAQASGIITRFVCDQLTNSCKANQSAKDTCAKAITAANAAGAKTGAAADAFNAAFGITTNFKAVQQIDDQGRVVAAA